MARHCRTRCNATVPRRNRPDLEDTQTLAALRRGIWDVVQTLKFAAERNLRIKSADAGATATALFARGRCDISSDLTRQSTQYSASPATLN